MHLFRKVLLALRVGLHILLFEGERHVARAEQALEEMEEKLGCVARARHQQQAPDKIVRAAAALRAVPQAEDLADTILAAAQEIKE